MSLRTWDLYFDLLKVICTFLAQLSIQKFQSIVHRYTYRTSSDPRNVIVIGGSFAGALLAQRLTHTLPSGYRVILIEKHSHFNFAFGFPRNAVFSGREHHAFVSYENLAKGAPDGIFQQVCDEVTDITESRINTSSGMSLAYEYLILATGAAQPPPARLLAKDRPDAIEELRGFQQRISKADRVAVIGGGAVGVELVTEIRAKYPDKRITLIHSRHHLLPRFGVKLHEHVLETLRKQGIEVLLCEKPAYPSDAGQRVQETSLTFADGETRTWDLVVGHIQDHVSWTSCDWLRPLDSLHRLASTVGTIERSLPKKHCTKWRGYRRTNFTSQTFAFVQEQHIRSRRRGSNGWPKTSSGRHHASRDCDQKSCSTYQGRYSQRQICSSFLWEHAEPDTGEGKPAVQFIITWSLYWLDIRTLRSCGCKRETTNGSKRQKV